MNHISNMSVFTGEQVILVKPTAIRGGLDFTDGHPNEAHMKIALLVLTFTVGVAGWIWPHSAPLWLRLAVVGVMVVALAVEIHLERNAHAEAAELRSTLAEVHASETARPEFELAVNGITIAFRNQWIDVPADQTELPFVLRLKNIGSTTASEVQAFLWLPEDVGLPTLGRHWISNGTPMKPRSIGERLEGVAEYAFLSPVAINAGNWLTMGNGKLPIPPHATRILLRLKVYASGGVFQEWTFGTRIPADAQ